MWLPSRHAASFSSDACEKGERWLATLSSVRTVLVRSASAIASRPTWVGVRVGAAVIRLGVAVGVASYISPISPLYLATEEIELLSRLSEVSAGLVRSDSAMHTWWGDVGEM